MLHNSLSLRPAHPSHVMSVFLCGIWSIILYYILLTSANSVHSNRLILISPHRLELFVVPAFCRQPEQ